MEGAGSGGHRPCYTSGSGQCSFRTSLSSMLDIASEVVEEGSLPVQDKVFVAVAEKLKCGKSTLLWALQNLAKDGSKIVIAHVHCPAQTIPMMGLGAKVHYTRMKPQEVNAYRNLERETAKKNLDEYVLICTRLKVSCEKAIIEMDDVAKGLEELVALHGITKLVMGAAADKHYSKTMRTPRSKTALKVMETAAASCKIWFTCNGQLMCTREANTAVPAIPPSPAHTVESALSASSISSHMRSVTIQRSENEALGSYESPTIDRNRSRMEVVRSPCQGAGCTPRQLFESIRPNLHRRTTRTSSGSVDSWDEFGRRSESSGYGSSRNDDAVSISGSAMRRLTQESDDDLSPSHELEDPGVDADIYDRLKEAHNEAEYRKKEAYEESNRRRKCERDLLSALQRVKESQNSYLHEMRQRKAIEEMLATSRQEIEEMKRQRDATYDELHDAEDHKLVLEQRITEMESSLKDHEERLAEIQVLQADHDKLLQQRDAAVTEAEELRKIYEQRVSTPSEALNTEFSFFELQQSTQGFDEALKIGEGGFGRVFKGFLRNTAVAIKLLDPLSMQGQLEFHQEVAVLSRVRHPNLVTLIGVCPEEYGLVYEFLPNGSLEDRLACMNNTPPLIWQVRTRIIGEICSALVFLHSNKPHLVVHGDLKPGNILLDGNFVSKLGDFGICQLLIQSNNTTTTLYRTKNPRGTFPYMDPELLSTGEVTPRSDVYSFGIIILRLLTGRPPQRIAGIVEEAVERGELHAVIDPSAGSWPFVQANQLAHIGLRCAELSRRRRPDLAGEVWKVIEPLMKVASLTAWPATFAPSSDDAYTPSYFVCPIFQEVMSDPHIAADGFTYEAEAIKGWLDSGHDTSPMTNMRLAHCDLTPNRVLRSAILEWRQQQQH